MKEKTNFEDNFQIDLDLNENNEEPEIEYTREDYNAWIAEQRKIMDEEFAEIEKVRTKTFDEIVKKYSILIGLRGNSYTDITKLIFYSVLANQIKTNTFTMESKNIDLRLNLLMQLKAGHGKKNYEYFIRRTIEGLGKLYYEPTSYHPEQFVGKVLVKEKKDGYEYQQVHGTLAGDYVVIDEAHALLTMQKNEECLKYLRTALDPIGDNRIEKKQVNVPNEEMMVYYPNCTVILLTQPITNVNEELLIRGSFRRFIICFLQTTFEERLQARRESKFLTLQQDIHNKVWISWLDLNRQLMGYKNLKYICPDFSKIDDYLDDIAKKSQSTNIEVLEFFNTSQFTIKQNIFKMAIVRAVLEHQTGDTVTIQSSHINAAIKDWHAIWAPQVRWIAQQLEIQSNKPRNWNEETHGVMIDILKLKFNGKAFAIDLINKFYAGKQVTQYMKTKAYRILTDFVVWGLIMKEKKDSKYIITLTEKETTYNVSNILSNIK